MDIGGRWLLSSVLRMTSGTARGEFSAGQGRNPGRRGEEYIYQWHHLTTAGDSHSCSMIVSVLRQSTVYSLQMIGT